MKYYCFHSNIENSLEFFVNILNNYVGDLVYNVNVECGIGIQDVLMLGAMGTINVNEIKENQKVKDAMDAAWRQALEDANNGIRREYYFLIYYRSNGVFDCSSATPGPVINNCNTHADINITYYDDPDLCAYFHTHTSLKFCPDTLSRSTGPSEIDLNSNIAQQVPCLVRDFESQYLDGGMDHSIIPDSIYIYGVKRRTLEHIGSNNN